MEFKFEERTIALVKGDITKQEVDIIVNAANPSLRGGGGVDGAIHRAGGEVILQECIQKYPHGCKTGEARITTAGKMAAKWVIHTPGPVWKGGHVGEVSLLESSYRNSISLANEYKADSIAFPSISTGVYGFPIHLAAKIAIKTVLSMFSRTTLSRVHFVLFSEKDFQIYFKELKNFIIN
ncbi:MAG: O-acetyl-ADP-ribose deacetylase [Candidatus Heimdallarchaeota archaeon]|nr:O-acetyl-ADP-ribose deacetylase [Candidatus Heimdallarchaeota archaeon]